MLKSLSMPSTLVLALIREVLNEGGEEGMYGRASVLLAEMIQLYDGSFPADVSLRLCAPLRTANGRAIIDYAVMIIYVV